MKNNCALKPDRTYFFFIGVTVGELKKCLLSREEFHSPNSFLIILNGLILDKHKRPQLFANGMRTLQRAGKVGDFVSIYVNEKQRCVYIASDGGRVCRPLVIAGNGVSRIKHHHWKELKAYCRHLLNAVSIEHSILRLPYRLKSSCARSPERNETEIHEKFRLEWSEPLVTFALCSGSWSSHVVRVYTATQVENEIATTKREYLQAAFGIMKTCKLIGPYQFQMFVPTGSTLPTLQTAEDLQGDELLHYDAEIELMNLINTKFLNSLQPEWLKYVTQVRLAKRLTVDSFDDLFDYLQQFEKLVNASRAKKLEKSHDPLALVAHTACLMFQTNSEDPLASAMLLLTRAITQNFSNPTNNRLRTSSNTRNQAIIQGDRVNIQSRNSGNTGRNTRRAYVQEEVVEGSNAQNETGNVQRTLRTSSSGNNSTVQCYNCSGKGHYARNCPKPRVRDSKYFMEQMLLAKQDEAGVILTDEQNDFLFADASRMEEIEELSANICLMARIQPADNTSDAGPSYDSAFISEVQSSSIKR
ncbi:retrovirus-related pol polyprotein from transposon TNT 1-94 [Tanacetum coccineum]